MGGGIFHCWPYSCYAGISVNMLRHVRVCVCDVLTCVRVSLPANNDDSSCNK